MPIRSAALLLALLTMHGASAQSLEQRFLTLAGTQGVAGHEADVRANIRSQLPAWSRPQVDGLGNLQLSFGTGAPHTVLVAPLDESGFVVSRITNDGYLRLHRHTAATGNVLRDQFAVGQPVQIRTASGRMVPGVTATPSLHLSRLLGAPELRRIRDIGDLWVDVGASNAATVAALGVRNLDPVNLRERAQPLANGRVAGLNTQWRAGAQTLVELMRGLAAEPSGGGTVTLVWAAQSQFNGRGLARVAQSLTPDKLVMLGTPVARTKAIPPQWAAVPVDWMGVPSLYPETPVEVVDTHDITGLAQSLAAKLGLTLAEDRLPAAQAEPVAPAKPSSPPFALLKPLIESYGVSGHEAPVRELVKRMLPAWAKPETDEKGNLSFSFGQGGDALLFIAHLDEVGFEITGILPDGSATLRDVGGMYLSLYEALPVYVQGPSGHIAAVIAPRADYATSAVAQPADGSMKLYFGTGSAEQSRALGVAIGQGVTLRKRFVELANQRATGRAMDDRVGIAAILLALKQIDPGKVGHRVTIAFSVEEETGLSGAQALAKRLKPDYAFAIDTFVSTDTPSDPQYLAYAPLGKGPVLRGMDNRILTPAATIDRIMRAARGAKIALQLGVTQGGVDSSAFSAGGAVDVGLSWPGRYSHSGVEVVDQRDLEELARLLAQMMKRF
jgi:putative aminopeptidase FrvX